MSDAAINTDFERVAADRYGIIGTASPLPGEIDSNARLTTPTGVSYVLRISPPSTDMARLGFIDAVMEKAAAVPIRTPTVVASLNGSPHEVLEDGSILRVTTWVQGRTPPDDLIPASAARSLGGVAGAMVRALDSVSMPAEAETTRWDLRTADDTIEASMAALSTDRERALVTEVLAMYRNVPRSALPCQVVHNDLNPGNLLFDNGMLVGVIDFGDVTETYRIAELAIACAYAALEKDDPISTVTDVCAGYRSAVEGSVYEPTASEAEALFPLLLARLATSATVAATRDPNDAYLQISRGPAWRLLERLIPADVSLIAAEIRAAVLGLPPPSVAPTVDRTVIASALSVSYDTPLTMTSGKGAYLFDNRGRRYLDAVNNVCHVGHSHPTVVRAAADQMAILNTNTRYLHPELPRYAKRLTATLPDHLDTVFLTNSGSEANELAIRLARTATGRTDLACIDHAYHGNTSTLISVSPYKFNGPGGERRQQGVAVLPSFDGYRNPQLNGPSAGAAYASLAREALATVTPAALIIEALAGCGGQIVPEADVVAAACAEAGRAGALVIADEVQTGLGRVGSHFWAFQLFGLSPDIVTFGKPAGNGHPVAGVVTTGAIANAFDNGMEYFNTFGGNPVSAAVGNAVLDVIEGEGLQENAADVGALLKQRLAQLATHHQSIGDVRGAGLFIGVELVVNRDSKEPDAPLTHTVIENARAHGVLLSSDGPAHNVIKIKPPLVFSEEDADLLTATLREALTLN